MYISNHFGAWQVNNDDAAGPVEFKIFFPDRTKDEEQYGQQPQSQTYGNPQIDTIQVVGDFMHYLGWADWDQKLAPYMTCGTHAKGWVWSYRSPIPLHAGFYQYKYLVTFQNGERRWVGDPCARYGGSENQNSAFVIGGSRPEENMVSPLAEGRKHLRDLVVYELMVDDFTDEYRGFRAPLDAVRDKLDYLQNDLGINAILFLPWTAWPGMGFSWGYTPHQYFSLEYRYANALNAPSEKLSWLKKLVNECHLRGIHVIMDGVFNHVGDADLASDMAFGFPYRWLYQDPEDSPYVGAFGGKFPGLIDVDYNNGCTQEFILDVCRYWIDTCGIDGIRFDNTTNYYIRGDRRGLPRLLEDIRNHVKDPNFSLILEHIDLSAAGVTNEVGATSYWNDALYQQTFAGLWNGSPGPQFINALNSHVCLDPDKVATTYLGNHDHAHVAWQAGARSNRGALDWARVKPYVIALMTMPGCPLVQNGQEFAEDYWVMEDDYGTGRRVQPRPLRWGFCCDGIGGSLRKIFRELIALRMKYRGLRSDDIYPGNWESWQTQFNPEGYGLDAAKGVIIFHRWGYADGVLQRFIIVLNFSQSNQVVDIPFSANGLWQELLDERHVQVSDCRIANAVVESNSGLIYLLEG